MNMILNKKLGIINTDPYKTMPKQDPAVKESYNNIPVIYCAKCNSLDIIECLNDSIGEYCNKCGCTITNSTHISN